MKRVIAGRRGKNTLPADPNDPVVIRAIGDAESNMLFNIVVGLVTIASSSDDGRDRALALLAGFEATIDQWDPFPVDYDGDGNPLPIAALHDRKPLELAEREKIRTATLVRLAGTMKALRDRAENPPQIPDDAE